MEEGETAVKSAGRNGETPAGAVAAASATADDSIRVDDLHIDVRTRRVFRDGVELAVTGLSFDLLLALVRAAPALVTFDALMETVWPGVIVSPETLTQRVKLLRQALGDSADQPRYIMAVRGHGYRLREAATRAVPQAAANTAAAPTAGWGRRWMMAGGVLVLVVAVIVLWRLPAFSTATPAVSIATLQEDALEYVSQAKTIVDGSPKSFLAAIHLYDEALTRDPDLVAALTGRAMNRAALVWNGSPLSHGLDLAQQDAEQALKLDPANADALSALASINTMRGDWLVAEKSFQAAMSAHPDNADVRARYALSLLLPTGQLRKAVAEAIRAQQMAADSGGFTAAMLAFARGAQGDDTEAMRYADLMISRGGDPRQVAHIYIAAAVRQGRYSEAADRAIAMLPLDVRDAGGEAALRQAFAALNHPEQQRAAVAGLRKLVGDSTWDHNDTWGRWPVLYLYASLGAQDELYSEMGRILHREGARFPQIIAIGSLWSSDMRAFRQDRRFSPLVESLGLIDYWQQVGPPDGCRVEHSSLVCAAR